MTECERLSDRMVLVAHGRAQWTGEEAAHLASCADCGAEWRLVRAALRLGSPAAAQINSTLAGRAVLARLAARRRWQRVGWAGLLAAAATVVIVVWVARPKGESVVATAAPAVEFHLPLAELESLDSLQLQSVLDGLDAPIGAGANSDAPKLGDLENSELERVLRSLEG